MFSYSPTIYFHISQIYLGVPRSYVGQQVFTCIKSTWTWGLRFWALITWSAWSGCHFYGLEQAGFVWFIQANPMTDPNGAAIYGVPWIPSIYPHLVSIYTSTMDSYRNRKIYPNLPHHMHWLSSHLWTLPGRLEPRVPRCCTKMGGARFFIVENRPNHGAENHGTAASCAIDLRWSQVV